MTLGRRFAALLIGILSIHLNVVGVDLTCADHARRDVSNHDAAAMQHHAMPTDDASVADAEPCDTPTQPDCCRAMTSCAVTVALEVDTHADGIASSRERIAPSAAELLLSHASPPDPPPPKA